MALPEMVIRLPAWVETFLASQPAGWPCLEDRLGLAIALARLNTLHGTGGPFGAAVFAADGRLVAPGVNLVVPTGCSILHAEMVALALAQRRVGSFDLSRGPAAPYELCASTEPCAMCFGALPWSGIARLVCGARDEDARAVGFDEGPKLPDWPAALARRHIEVVRDVRRQEAVRGLLDYAARGGQIYTPGRGSPPPSTSSPEPGP